MCLLRHADSHSRRRRAAAAMIGYPALMVPIFLSVMCLNHAHLTGPAAGLFALSDFRVGIVVGILLGLSICSLVVLTLARRV